MDTTKRSYISRVKEYAKFGITGVINTLVDFAVLNAFLIAWGASQIEGGLYAIVKLISFCAAVVNSYYLNKYWVFADAKSGKLSEPGEGIKFLIVSVIGFLLNVIASYLVFISVASVGAHLAANIGAIVGTLVVLIWNYTGYKFFVFKSQIS